ncbi:50S ribosomal protein L35ae [Candidatus Woesearchaeota archaeon]|nr:50S ribosomal protein L35ae [Candidatus Woesearchaeota archaeon]
MQGVIVNYRRGKRTQNTFQMVIQPSGVSSKEKAQSLIGKGVTWKTPSGKPLKGVVTAAHGKSGAVRARFETGMPGQSLGGTVDIA